MNIAVILAGGVGARVGAERPKQFIEVMGKPILAYTIEKFQNHEQIDAIEVVCLAEYINYLKSVIKKYKFTKVKWVVEGGATFQYSVLNGIKNLDNKCSDKDIILVHFGASPFVEADIIADAIKVSLKTGNAISTTPFYLLAGMTDDGTKSSKGIDRDTIACMSSPHAFRFSYIRELYQNAINRNILDDIEPHTTSLMYFMGETIYFSKGSQANIKITTKEDLYLFEGYLLMKQKRSDVN